MHDEHHEEGEGCKGGCTSCHMAGPLKKEFKLAMLEKKEKILKVKLEFLNKIKDIVEKLPEPPKPHEHN